jgi:hypothetical protein
MVCTTLIGLLCLFGYLNYCVFCCSEVGYIKYIYIHVQYCPKWWQQNTYKVMALMVGWSQNLITLHYITVHIPFDAIYEQFKHHNITKEPIESTSILGLWSIFYLLTPS